MYRKHDGTGGYDFKDGYYIIDGRPEDGRFIRETNKQFYDMLNTLFT